MVMMNRFNFRQQHHEIIICASLSTPVHSSLDLTSHTGLKEGFEVHNGDIKITAFQNGDYSLQKFSFGDEVTLHLTYQESELSSVLEKFWSKFKILLCEPPLLSEIWLKLLLKSSPANSSKILSI